MSTSMQGLARAAALTAIGCILATGCASGPEDDPRRPAPTAHTAKDVSCDRDRSSIGAKDTVERVGGLTTDDYTVRFAQSTRLGVVALVDGDTDKAYADLTGTYGVALVAEIDDDSNARVTGFQQVRDLVASACG
jgi:hypothetical protein